ncbi:hypothetical protein OSB04_027388 [Centaurea solstitialis]|uniref:Glycosyltransferase n=1 Tax=Centaurea solstitialis TaxID=347529 RepID=A0AA38SXA0_9ASTR|nr:hypothetical protein OSB04_027388 [Centaurea solstitialis]
MAMVMAEEKAEVFFIPTPLMGHAGSLIQLATTMATRFHNLTINVLVMHLPNDLLLTNYTNSIASSQTNRINFIQFPQLDLNDLPNCPSAGFLADAVIEHHKPIVRDLAAARPRLRALIVDMFCTSMIDVGKELGIPTYTFFTSGAAFLGIMFHFQTLHDEHGQDISELANPGPPIPVPSYAVPIPPSILPFVFFDKDSWSKRFLRYARKYREAEGVIVNTFRELEPHALGSYDDRTPPVYTVGPMLKPETCTPDNEILRWLDGQPKSSVVLLCFGSRGCFNADQVKQIAIGLERSGYGFVWSLREPSSEGRKGFPQEYKDYNEVLPDGFLDRTAGKGKVVGWVPQTAVLDHEAVGGFVSHCGWNSILESIWYGVPIATWPLYAEQQLDAHQLVKELGLAVEISLDYNQLDKNQRLVLAEEIEKGIRQVMDSGSEVRAKVAEMKAKSRMAVEDGGSSFTSLGQLVDHWVS